MTSFYHAESVSKQIRWHFDLIQLEVNPVKLKIIWKCQNQRENILECELIIVLMGMDMLVSFCAIFHKGGNFCYFLFAFLHTISFRKGV